MTCPQLFDVKDTIIVNGAVVNLDFRLLCKDKNIVYVAQCQICSSLPGTPGAYSGFSKGGGKHGKEPA